MLPGSFSPLSAWRSIRIFSSVVYLLPFIVCVLSSWTRLTFQVDQFSWSRPRPPFCPNLCTGVTLRLISRSPASNSTTDLANCLPSRECSSLSFTANDYDRKSTRCKLNIFQTDPLPVQPKVRSTHSLLFYTCTDCRLISSRALLI